MKPKIEIPKGWRRLRVGTIRQKGDHGAVVFGRELTEWIPTRRVGQPVEARANGWQVVYIRRIKRKAKK